MYPPKRSRHSSRGIALVALLALLAAGALYFYIDQLSANAIRAKRDEATVFALAQAKEALIGWSAARGSAGNPRPGELPCPDTDAPGTPNYGNEQGACVAGAIGRLPWKTLGIEELRDGYGEPLWYAIDGSFRKRPNNNNPINSDTRASMLAYSSDGTNLVTPSGKEAVAIIFAPGSVIGGQLRGTAAERTTASNYLESVGPPDIPLAIDNSVANGPFIQGFVKDAGGSVLLNDRLLIVSANDLMSIVEKRVANELAKLLTDYFAVNGYYPNPARFNNGNCLDVGAGGYLTSCMSDPAVCRGRIPIDELPAPVWFFYNLWGQAIYYAASSNRLATPPPGCPAVTVTVDGNPVSGVMFMPGTPRGAVVRNLPNQSTLLSDYLEDTMNQNGWTIPTDNYCSPGSALCLPTPATSFNDRIYVLP